MAAGNRKVTVDFLGRDKGFGRAADNMAKKSSGLGGSLAKLGAAFAGLAVISKATSFLKESVAEARESQKVGAQTAAVIKSTGGAANVTAKQFGKLSTAISLKTGIDDEAIQSGENMLATFTNIRNEVGKGNDIFNQATKLSVDMGAAMKMGPTQASLQLGKALNDPLKGMTRLTKVGVTFTDAQKKQVAQMMKVGDTAGAQKVILKELAKEFGGSAAAQATAGEKAKVAFENLKEQIGTALLPVIDKLEKALTTKIIPAISGFITQMQNGTGAGGKVADAFKRVGDVLSTVFKFIANNKTVVTVFVGAILAMVGAFALLNAVLAINPLTLVVVGIAALAAGLVYAYKHSETFRTAVDGLWNGVLKPFGSWLGKALPAAFRVVGTAVLTMARIHVEAFHFILDVALATFGGILHGAAKAFGWVPGIGGKIKTASRAFDSMKDTVDAALNKVESKLKSTQAGLDKLGRSSARPFVGMRTASFTAGLKYVIASMNKIGRLSASAKANLHGYASGTNSAARGLAIVGEQGPELVRFNGGEQVSTASQTRGMMSGGRGVSAGGTVNITVNGFVGSETQLATALQQVLLKKKRVTGVALGLA